jgi:SAM-dependent methyltransferase
VDDQPDKAVASRPESAPALPIPVLRPKLASTAQFAPYLRAIDEPRCDSNYGTLATRLQAELGRHTEDQSVLVFPAGMPAGLAFAHEALRRGRRVLGASSLAHDPERNNYPEWTRLPGVLDEDFSKALAAAIAAYRVREIYTPHPVVWDRLNALLPSLLVAVRLHPPDWDQDWDKDLAGYARQRAMADEFPRRAWQTFRGSNLRPALPGAHSAGLIRLFEMTPGQCAHSKLEAIISLFRDLPEGDIVEIGTLFGRTALAFAFLANRYRTGKVLCVDPWTSEELNHDTEEVDAHSAKVPIQKVPIQEIFEAFTATLAPWSGIVNYIREPSVVASAIYASGAPVVSPEFGTTEYSLGISLLHINGNHAVDAVRNDLRAWGGFLRPDGWIVFDDYRGPFGDGPRHVADEFCRDFEGHWSTAFEAGGALFVRLNGTKAFHSANHSLLWDCARLP